MRYMRGSARECTERPAKRLAEFEIFDNLKNTDFRLTSDSPSD